MKFCTNCGAKLEEGVKFCPECGKKIEEVKAPEVIEETIEKTVEEAPAEIKETAAPIVETAPVVEAAPAFKAAPVYEATPVVEETKGPWKVFAKLGKILGIISFIWSFIPFFGLYSYITSIPGLVFGILGKKYKKNGKGVKTGLGFNIAAMIIAIVAFVVAIVVITVVGGSLGGEIIREIPDFDFEDIFDAIDGFARTFIIR